MGAIKIPRLSEIDKHIGSRIRMLRKINGLTQSDLGKILGITFQQVQKYEKGFSVISPTQLFSLARYFGTDVSYFYEKLEETLYEMDDRSRGVYPSLSDTALRIAHTIENIADDDTREKLLSLVESLAEVT